MRGLLLLAYSLSYVAKYAKGSWHLIFSGDNHSDNDDEIEDDDEVPPNSEEAGNVMGKRMHIRMNYSILNAEMFGGENKCEELEVRSEGSEHVRLTYQATALESSDLGSKQASSHCSAVA